MRAQLLPPLRDRTPAAISLCIVALLFCARGCQAVWPYPEAFHLGSRTFCLARHISWRSEGFTSDILEAGFDR